METIRTRSGYRPYSSVFGVEYQPFEISTNLLENIYYASQSQTKSAWEDNDDELIRGYNYNVRGREKKYIFVIGVMTDEGRERVYKQFNLRVTHSRIAEEKLPDMEYHLSLVLWPWEDGPNPENYVPTLCSPKNFFKFHIIDVNRKKRLIDASADGILYNGIAPPYVYELAMLANMLHKEWGSSVITRYKPDEEKDIPLDKPKTIRFGRTEETAIKRLKNYTGRQFHNHSH